MSLERRLLQHIQEYLAASGFSFPRPMIVDYYVSLKSTPFVILTGKQGYGKIEIVRLFAEAIIGPTDHQYVLIQGGTRWADGTGEERYFHDLQARFSSFRFIETLQDASTPMGEGKIFFLCLERLTPAEVEYYFSSLLISDEEGRRRLRLPGQKPERYPIVPENLYITATVDDSERAYRLSSAVLDNASPIEFRLRAAPAEPALTLAQAVPPVGFQRIFLRSAVRRIDAARRKLSTILGPDWLRILRPSRNLGRLLARAGVRMRNRTFQELIRYTANAFDEEGVGFFDPDSATHNALMALDSQVAQKVLWRLRGSHDLRLQRNLEAYLDQLFPFAFERYHRMRENG